MKLKKTFPKILFLIASSSVFFLLLYATLFYYINKTEKEAYQNSVELFESKINKLLLLESKPILTVINNDTNWDEFVNFITTRDRKWYDVTIANELAIYGADYLGVYDQNKKFIIRTSKPNINSLNFIPKQVMEVLDRKGIKKFYLHIHEGIVEITGASIHPSNDPLKNKTKPSGYFFVVRLINAKFIKDLSNITTSKVSLLDVNQIVKEHRHVIYSTSLLKDVNGKLIGKLLFERPFQVYFENIITLLYFIILVFVLYLIVSLFLAQKLVYKPLFLVRKALEKGSKTAINELKNSSGEFSYIGKLFEENSNQKTALVKAKLKAEEGDLLKASFLANLSHEIRTPMNAINGFTELILNTKIEKKERIEYLNIIQNNGKNLVSIIDDLIEMSKIDAHQVAPNYNPINLESSMGEIYQTVKIIIPKDKKIEFKLIKPALLSEYNIITDEIKLRQVIINLVTNAIKYTDHGLITLGYEINEKENKLDFTIKDTGSGIDINHQKQVFDRFKRVENDRSISIGGLGLGLSISKAYVEILGGSIDLDSQVGVGSTFYFSIPLQFDTVKREIPRLQEIAATKNKSKVLLIAEDDAINFLLFQKMMQNEDYEIIRALNGKEAVEMCTSNYAIDLVLMDIKMPIMDGFDATELIRLFRPQLPIIAQTAYSSTEDKIKFEKYGFDGYLTKPLNRVLLFEMINKF